MKRETLSTPGIYHSRCTRSFAQRIMLKNMIFVVADIACLPAPENVKNQENFFSANRKNKINFIL
jgi:hypothetical protein